MGVLASINVEEHMFFDWQDGTQKEGMVFGHLELADICKMLCCPLCCCIIPLKGDRTQIEYRRECSGCCDCPYAVYPCWPCVQCCAMFCAPLGVVCLSMKGCCQYCSEEEFMTITQPVYAGPWSRDSGAEPSQIGNMNLAFRFVPMSCCCACPKPLKVWFDPTTEQGQKVGAENIALLSVILAVYRGLENPCKLCAGKDFQQPTGVSCLDLGLNTTVVWRNLGAVMKDSA